MTAFSRCIQANGDSVHTGSRVGPERQAAIGSRGTVAQRHRFAFGLCPGADRNGAFDLARTIVGPQADGDVFVAFDVATCFTAQRDVVVSIHRGACLMADGGAFIALDVISSGAADGDVVALVIGCRCARTNARILTQ